MGVIAVKFVGVRNLRANQRSKELCIAIPLILAIYGGF